MKIRMCVSGEKECCANCDNLELMRYFGKAYAVCKIDGHKVTFAYKKICDEWERFV